MRSPKVYTTAGSFPATAAAFLNSALTSPYKKETKLLRPPPKIRSHLQSRAGYSRKGTFVPDWAEAITPDFAERCALGKLDYWLGLDPNKKIRARGRFRHMDSDGLEWLVTTARSFAWQIGARSKIQAWRIIDRLHRKGFVIKERHVRLDGWVAMRLRLNWYEIEAAYAAATPAEATDD